MEDPKRHFKSGKPGKPGKPDAVPKAERRRLSKIVHDHKGNAIVEWYDAPADYERPVLEIEGARQPATPPRQGLRTGSLAIEKEDTHDPYMRIPETVRKRVPGQKTDLRKLSAWIKMMRELEEAKKRNSED